MEAGLTEAIGGVVAALVALANAIIYYVVVPFVKARTSREQRELAYGIVKSAVGYAEHLGKVHGFDGASKKRRAVDWIKDEFLHEGIAFDEKEVDGWIEDVLQGLSYAVVELVPEDEG